MKTIFFALIFIILVSGCVEANTVCIPRGCNIYPVDAITDERILPTDNITIDASNYYNISAAPGEYEPFSFIIRPTRNMQVSLSATGLDCDIRVVKVWNQAGLDIFKTNEKQLVPELLLKDASLVKVDGGSNFLKMSNGTYINISGGPGSLPVNPLVSQMPVVDAEELQPVDLVQDQNTQFLVTVIGTTPGVHTGEILVKNTTDGRVIRNIYVNLTVHDFNLSAPVVDYGMYYQSIISSDARIDSRYKNASQVTAELADLKAHGIEYPGMYYQNGNDVQMLDLRQSTGLDNKSFFYMGAPQFQDYGTDSQALINVIGVLKNRFASYGFENVYLYGPDETYLNDSVHRQQIATVHGQGWKVFDSQSGPDAWDIADALDMAIVYGEPDTTLAYEYHDLCNEVASYGNPQGSIELPGSQRLNYGLLLWQNDYDAAFPFAYMWRYGNVWDDFDYPNIRDHNFVYPTANGVVDTLQWEGFREGVDDIRYLSTLLAAIECSENTTEAENWLVDLKTQELVPEDLPAVRARMVDYIEAIAP